MIAQPAMRYDGKIPWLLWVCMSGGEMDESRTTRLRELLRRLGQAVHSTVATSEEVRSCLEELHGEGWSAVMFLETSLACDENGVTKPNGGTLRLHVDTDNRNPAYRIDVSDAQFLSSLGIASGRYRSPGTTVPRARVERDTDSDG